jgi:hypothetical protein
MAINIRTGEYLHNRCSEANQSEEQQKHAEYPKNILIRNFFYFDRQSITTYLFPLHFNTIRQLFSAHLFYFHGRKGPFGFFWI